MDLANVELKLEKSPSAASSLPFSVLLLVLAFPSEVLPRMNAMRKGGDIGHS